VHRRALPRATALAGVGLAGCTAPTSRGATSTDASPTVTPDPILIVLSNGQQAALSVTVTVTRDGGAIFKEAVSLDADARRELDPGIATTGEYELTVAVTDGPERTVPLTVESDDVRVGSNAIVEIDAETIRVLVEE
jgi:hypothetical protein